MTPTHAAGVAIDRDEIAVRLDVQVAGARARDRLDRFAREWRGAERVAGTRIDDVEVGKRVAGPVRLALNIGENNIEQAAAECLAGGATQIASIAQAPWSKVMRLQDPSGMQFTLFETSTLFPPE